MLDTEFLKGKLIPHDIFFGSIPLFMHALESLKHPTIKSILQFPKLKEKVADLLSWEDGKCPKFIDLTVTFVPVNSTVIVQNTPGIRVYFTSWFFDDY